MDDASAWRAHGMRDTDPATVAVELTAGTIPGVAAETAARRGEHAALVFGTVAGPRYTSPITHGELDAAAARTAGWLAARGVRRGDRVLLCGRNTGTLVTAYLAILRAGAVVVLANPAYTADELEHLVSDSGAARACAAEPAAETLRGLGVEVVSLDEDLPTAAPVPVADIGSDDLAMLAYTSGTTGRPKGVPLTHGNLLSSIRAVMLCWRWSEDDVLVHALPLSHQHGLGGVHATLIAGSSAVIFDAFDPAALAVAAREYGASVLFAVPSIYRKLVDDPDSARALGAVGLRLAISGSAPLSPELAAEITDLTGLVPLERYGSTEGGLDVSNPYDGARKIGTVGIPVPGIELRLADESGSDVADGEEGEVLVRGPLVFSGYWNRPEETAAVFHDGGWFRTGDLGRRDGDGYLSITGRIKELIITGGMNVYPREVELALERHPAVAAAAVAGLPSQRWGEQVTAWVVPEPGSDVDPEELLSHTKTLLAGYKRPKRVFLAESLPRNSMGKLQRRALVESAGDPEVDLTALRRATRNLRGAEL